MAGWGKRGRKEAHVGGFGEENEGEFWIGEDPNEEEKKSGGGGMGRMGQDP